MGRITVGVLTVAMLVALGGTAFAKKGFYIGGGYASLSSSGDIDGKSQVQNPSNGDVGSLGKLASGSGLNLDLGYNFNDNFGFEYFATATTHKAKNQAETKDTDSAVADQMYGVRLTAPVGDAFDLFARLGYGTSVVSYEKFGHQGSAAGAAKAFVLAGTGSVYGVGFDIYSGKHIGIGFGYTVFAVKYDRGAIDTGSSRSLPKDQSQQNSTGDVTITWHF